MRDLLTLIESALAQPLAGKRHRNHIVGPHLVSHTLAQQSSERSHQREVGSVLESPDQRIQRETIGSGHRDLREARRVCKTLAAYFGSQRSCRANRTSLATQARQLVMARLTQNASGFSA
jgi:hypothetical protein